MDQNSSQILSQIQANQATNKGAGDYLNEANNKLGVSGAQDTVTGLRTSINNTTKLLEKVAPSVMGRTQNSLVTNAQATRQIGNEQAPISKNLTELGGQYVEAGQNLSTLKNQATQEAQLGYQSQQDKQSYLQNLYNTMYGKETDAATAARQVAQDAEDKRRYEATKAENTRQFNVSQANAAADKKAGAAPTISKNAAGGWQVSDPQLDLAGYARATGKDLITLLSQGDAKDKQAAKYYKDNINLGRGEAYAMDRLMHYDRPSAFYLGG